MAAATAKYYFPFRICWCHCLQKVKVYEQTKLCRHISIGGWDLITSVFEKQTSAILEFYFRFWSRPLPIICMSFCITLPNFVQIGAPIAEIWRHFHFSRWRPRPLNTSSGFVFVDVTVFRRSKSQKTKFRRHISIGGWDITTSVFEIQTSAILEIYFWFRSQPVRRNLHVIMHQATEFRPNRSTHSATAKYYFRFYICWCHCLQKVKVYQQTKFRQGSSIGGWDITTSGFEIQTSAILVFYFRFRSRPFRHNWRVILHQAAEFRPNWNIRRWNMTLYIDFQDGGSQPCCICFRVMADHPRSAFYGPNSDLKSLVRRINSSGDIAKVLLLLSLYNGRPAYDELRLFW